MFYFKILSKTENICLYRIIFLIFYLCYNYLIYLKQFLQEFVLIDRRELAPLQDYIDKLAGRETR